MGVKIGDAKVSSPIEMVHTHPLHFKDPKMIKIILPVGDVEAWDIVGESAPPLGKGIIFLLGPTL